MPSLNQYGARVANMLNQQGNHDIMERAKDAIKENFATRIRQSIERHGIDDLFKLSFVALVEEMDYSTIYPFERRIIDPPKLLGTVNKIPVPMRFQNDAPFTHVGSVDGISFLYTNGSRGITKFLQPLYPTGLPVTYQYINGRIILTKQAPNLETVDRSPINEIVIESIWENPEEVLTMYDDVDGQDVELPFPNDMMISIINEVVRSEFGNYQKDVDLSINQGEVPSING